MQHIDIEKKRPSRWPWLAGAVIAALVVWGVTTLLREPPEDEVPVVADAAVDTIRPTAIPSPDSRDFGDDSETNLSALVPLGEDDIGKALVLEGEVVATASASFWIVADSLVLRVDSDRQARKGDTVSVAGTVQSADDELTERIASQVISRHPDSESWTVVRPFKLVEQTRPASPAADTS